MVCEDHDAMASAPDRLDAAILDLASDNDGLWEFTFMAGHHQRDPVDVRIERVSANPEFFRDLHQAMVDLVRVGYLTIRTGSGDDLTTDEAVAVLGDASNWELGPDAENDGYRVALTARGEAARTT